MQAIMETLFDACYLVGVVVLGLCILKNSREKQYRLFGVMAVTLGAGDAFHLVPRAYALLTDGLQAHAAALGVGKLVTSVTMTVFYVLLFYVWKQRYHRKEAQRGLTAAVWALAAVRVVLCLFPQNNWLSPHPPLSWGIARNVPFAALGLLVIVLFYRAAGKDKKDGYRFMWLAVTLSFAFYIPVVLWAEALPAVGMLMIPKTLAYVWVVWMGWKEARRAVSC